MVIREKLRKNGIQAPREIDRLEGLQTHELKENLDKLITTLKRWNIQRIAFFDEMGSRPSKIRNQKRLTLLVYPTCYLEEGDAFKVQGEIIESAPPEHRRKSLYLFPKDNWVGGEGGAMVYHKKKNVIATGIDPFMNATSLELLERYLSDLNSRHRIIYRDEETLLNEEISNSILGFQESKKKEFEIREEEKKKELSMVEEQLHRVYKFYRQAYRDRMGQEAIIAEMKKELPESVAKAKELPFIKSVSIREGRPTFYYGEIYLKGKITTKVKTDMFGDTEADEVQNLPIYIGQISITLKEGGTFEVINHDNKLGDTEHPHCTRGIPCLGEYRHPLASAFDRGDLVEVLKTIYSWLTTYTHDSVYQELQSWYNRKHGVNYPTPIGG